jgi:hypothetical protein
MPLSLRPPRATAVLLRALLTAFIAALGVCGLGATGSAGAAGAQAQAREAVEARRAEERMRQQVEAADRAAQQQRADAERLTE